LFAVCLSGRKSGKRGAREKTVVSAVEGGETQSIPKSLSIPFGGVSCR